MNKKWISLLCIIALLALGCAGALAEGEKIALITMDSIDQHWVTLNEGAQKAARGARRHRHIHGAEYQG